MYHGNNDYISIVEKTDERYHRSHVILHQGGTFFHVASFDTVEQLDFFAQTVGFTYSLVEERESELFGLYQEYSIDRKFDNRCGGGFWKLEQIPAGAKPIKALSNGSIVTCYYTNDGETIKIHRPNPNAKEVYKPLAIPQHIEHQRIYGCY